MYRPPQGGMYAQTGAELKCSLLELIIGTLRLNPQKIRLQLKRQHQPDSLVPGQKEVVVDTGTQTENIVRIGTGQATGKSKVHVDAGIFEKDPEHPLLEVKTVTARCSRVTLKRKLTCLPAHRERGVVKGVAEAVGTAINREHLSQRSVR